jgi:ribosome-associated protein
MDGDLTVSPRIKIPGSELEFSYARSSGPGGQNVNKVSSKAVLRWKPGQSQGLSEAVRARFVAAYGSRLTKEGELILSSQHSRDRLKNIADCLNRLTGLILAVAVAPKTRRPTKPSRGSIERRIKAKKESTDKKQGRKPPSLD